MACNSDRGGNALTLIIDIEAIWVCVRVMSVWLLQNAKWVKCIVDARAFIFRLAYSRACMLDNGA